MIFKKNIYIYSETLTPRISKCEFSQPGGTGVAITQQRKVVVIWKLAQMWRKTFRRKSWSLFLTFGSKFELHHKITWLVDYLLPWQPYRKSGFMISCGMSICIFTPNMSIRAITVFELWRHPCLANQRTCMITMATRWKWYINFESLWPGLQCDIWHIRVKF